LQPHFLPRPDEAKRTGGGVEPDFELAAARDDGHEGRVRAGALAHLGDYVSDFTADRSGERQLVRPQQRRALFGDGGALRGHLRLALGCFEPALRDLRVDGAEGFALRDDPLIDAFDFGAAGKDLSAGILDLALAPGPFRGKPGGSAHRGFGEADLTCRKGALTLQRADGRGEAGFLLREGLSGGGAEHGCKLLLARKLHFLALEFADLVYDAALPLRERNGDERIARLDLAAGADMNLPDLGRGVGIDAGDPAIVGDHSPHLLARRILAEDEDGNQRERDEQHQRGIDARMRRNGGDDRTRKPLPPGFDHFLPE
jgi:hypothetical protein